MRRQQFRGMDAYTIAHAFHRVPGAAQIEVRVWSGEGLAGGFENDAGFSGAVSRGDEGGLKL